MKVNIGDKIFLKSNPFEVGDFLIPGIKIVTDVKNMYDSQWVMIEGYNDWIDIKWFKKYNGIN